MVGRRAEGGAGWRRVSANWRCAPHERAAGNTTERSGGRPLADLRVIDLSSGQTAGITTMVLADFGADVVNVEPPGGDPDRVLPNSPLWLRGKRSVVLDLEAAPGQGAAARAVVRGADVVVASYVPGTAEVAGADYPSLAALNPRLVYCIADGVGTSRAVRALPGAGGARRGEVGPDAVVPRVAAAGGPGVRGGAGREPRGLAGGGARDRGGAAGAGAVGPRTARGDESAAGDDPVRPPPG